MEITAEGGTDSNAEDDKLTPPPMPEHLPKLVELLLSKTPDVYKPAVAHAIFPPLATHLCKTTFKYIDNVEHEATLMCCLLAGTGAGKNCVQMPINMIKLHPGTDWEQQEGRFTCSVQPDRERTIRLVCGLTDQKRTEYAGLEEGLELELSGKAVLSDSDGNVQKELAFSKKKIELPPFIRKEAEALERNQSRYQWTDWLNLGFESGSGYLVEVIADLDAQYPAGERENLEVTLLSQDGEELERIPVTQIQPENPKAFGEIFTGEDIEEYLADASGAVFYIAETSGTETEPVQGRKADEGEAETQLLSLTH